MSASKNRKSRGGRNVVGLIHTSFASETTSKLFEDDYFIFELIKQLYDDDLDVATKIEILTVIEQHGSGVLPANSVDQAVTALLDVFKDMDTSPSSLSVAIQLLLTVTTIFIENEELMQSELCSTYVSLLTDCVNKINNLTTRRLRACCCQCLAEMEHWRPGLLWKWREILGRLAREEKTDVFQDYMFLLITVVGNQEGIESKEQDSRAKKGKKTVQNQSVGSSTDDRDRLSAVSLVMDNTFLMTPQGLSGIMCSIVKLVKTFKNLPPTIFKPLMLQYLPTMDSNIICLMLYIQREFNGEILSPNEEMRLLNRAVECINHPRFDVKTRLLIGQWILSYLQEEKSKPLALELRSSTVPVVFDPLDVHTLKLALRAQCSSVNGEEELSVDLHYLTQLSETTGGMRVTCALYHILFFHIARSSSEAVQNTVLRITRRLFKKFSHLIPVIVDFLRAVKTCQPESKLHREILNLLHDTVLSLPVKILLNNYHNYLQVLVLSAQDSDMYQQKPLRRMLDLVREAVLSVMDDWALGSLILSICRTMILHHHTNILYSYLGDLLYFMMNEYGDVDIRDHARFYYALLTLNSDSRAKDIIGADLMEGLQRGDNIADFFPGSVVQTAPPQINFLSSAPISWKREGLEIQYEMANEKQNFNFPVPVQDGLEEYWDHLLYLRTSMKCIMTANINDESDFDSLVAVSFHVSKNKIHFSEDVYLPYMTRKVPSTVCYNVKFNSPQLVVATVRAVFGHEAATYECELTPIEFRFTDFLLPFPWHNFNIPDKQQFFNTHWENYTEKSKDKCMGVESVKILKCTRQSLMDVWENALIRAGPDTGGEEDKGVDDYFFFLPSRFHLLFRVQDRTTDLVVHIASDYWPLLRYIDGYLDTLIQS